MDILTDQDTAFEVEDRRPELAFLPVGATEQHSRHLPLATDTLLGEQLSSQILAAVDRDEVALYPETVRDDRRDNPVAFDPIWQDMFSMKTLSGGEGHAGHPTQATAEKGLALACSLVENSARYLERILEMVERHDGY